MGAQATERMIADMRFGFGPSVGSASNRSEPRAEVLAALTHARDALIGNSELPDAQAALEIFLARRASISAAKSRLVDPQPDTAGEVVMRDPEMQPGHGSRSDRIRPAPDIPTVGSMLKTELDIRVDRALASEFPLLERLAWHWFNHFTVSANAGFVGMFSGAYDREAIRPNLLRSFLDMLTAATLHPAMLFYLDNRNSVGPGSAVGRGKNKRGLNENLARELLELHTLGVDGGYTQNDVIELAKVLTGWTVNIAPQVPRGEKRIAFDPRRHEPGPKKILGKTYRVDGPDQIHEVLADLAIHPATASNVTRRLADHFIGVGRAPALRTALRKSFLATNGDLMAVTRVLVTHDQAWMKERLKSTSPFEFISFVGRLLGRRVEPPRVDRSLVALGQPFWRCPVPAGWPEADDAWISPDALKTRLDWALELSTKVGPSVDVRKLADDAFGAGLSAPTRKAIMRAESARQGLALLIMSPELQRR